jgi:peptidoglycan/xylan/chitin deacetylase (PgdA/CDA1 family)
LGGRLRFTIFILLAFMLVGIVSGFVFQGKTASAKKTKSSSTEIPQTKPEALPFAPPKENIPLVKVIQRKRPAIDTKVIHYKDKVIVLTYHHFDEKESTYTMTPERFRQHLQVLKDDHYNVISMEDFIAFLNNQKDVPPNAVLITIDDGYHSVYRYAYPELAEMGYTATTFLIVGSVGNTNATPPFMTWDEVKEMHSNGYSFYSHTYDLHDEKPNDKGIKVPVLANHIYLPDKKRLETDQEYETKVKDDLVKAKNVLTEQLGNNLSMLCFPHGSYNKKLMEIAQQVGIKYFFTGIEGINTRKNREITRIDSGAPWMNAKNFERKLSHLH